MIELHREDLHLSLCPVHLAPTGLNSILGQPRERNRTITRDFHLADCLQGLDV